MLLSSPSSYSLSSSTDIPDSFHHDEENRRKELKKIKEEEEYKGK